ncbi:uncharacterized protein KY384_000588 [Bacidia gigantensis]|uniref:uncharacterized protein n=1 Tax=Bacidia gigantensis TaxID=2732470 RepID=UPI001D04C413|nr:uncharacterized protein KY384_000588 [Bacidia gigantensis]KAG8525828.1 hypothetical protein KY384_000588 [Bacidia gigantensis]
MSSPLFQSSQLSQLSPNKRSRRKSKYTYKHLTLLSQSSTACPLRAIAHIDLDAFYAQCEGVRLGIAEDQPLAVQQWQGLIAINYPARSYGLTRFLPLNEAKKLCPNLICQHVATWKEGEEKWAYRDDAAAHIGNQKVSLDPYRLESRRIFACIRDALPPVPKQRVEKASVDEVFLDLSAQIHVILLERYPELAGPPPYDDPTEKLPRPPTTTLDWDTDALVDLDASETEDDDPDWDDIVMLIGSEIIRRVRAAILEHVKYTCSAGIARNKMIAKLGSGHKKPNQQTIVRNRAVQHFLSQFKFTKIRNLGGKLGEEVVAKFNTDQVTDLLRTSLEQMKSKLGDDTGSWVYYIIRGEDTSEVNPRTQIKSMLSAKSFRPTINSTDQAHRWLRIFVADIYARLVEEGVLDNKRRPKIINLHHRQGGQQRSRQAAIPTGRPIDESLLFDLSKNILAQIIVDGRAWPCSNLSLSVGGFEEGPMGNKGIGGFLIRGDEAKAMTAISRDVRDTTPTGADHPAKRRKTETQSLPAFFARQDTEHRDTEEDADELEHSLESSSRPHSCERTSNGSLDDAVRSTDARADDAGGTDRAFQVSTSTEQQTKSQRSLHQTSIEAYICSRCQASIPVNEENEHQDWHFARDLQEQDSVPTQNPALPKSGSGHSPALNLLHNKVEKGQRRLAFGK